MYIICNLHAGNQGGGSSRGVIIIHSDGELFWGLCKKMLLSAMNVRSTILWPYYGTDCKLLFPVIFLFKMGQLTLCGVVKLGEDLARVLKDWRNIYGFQNNRLPWEAVQNKI